MHKIFDLQRESKDCSAAIVDMAGVISALFEKVAVVAVVVVQRLYSFDERTDTKNGPKYRTTQRFLCMSKGCIAKKQKSSTQHTVS